VKSIPQVKNEPRNDSSPIRITDLWLLKRQVPCVEVGDRAIRILFEALEKLIAENTISTRDAWR
jgi:hypothetical protein